MRRSCTPGLRRHCGGRQLAHCPCRRSLDRLQQVAIETAAVQRGSRASAKAPRPKSAKVRAVKPPKSRVSTADRRCRCTACRRRPGPPARLRRRVRPTAPVAPPADARSRRSPLIERLEAESQVAIGRAQTLATDGKAADVSAHTTSQADQTALLRTARQRMRGTLHQIAGRRSVRRAGRWCSTAQSSAPADSLHEAVDRLFKRERAPDFVHRTAFRCLPANQPPSLLLELQDGCQARCRASSANPWGSVT